MKLYRIIKTSATAIAVAIMLGISAHASAANIAQGFLTDDTELRLGMVAALANEASENSNIVVRAGSGNKDKVVGVVTSIEDSLVTLTDTSAKVFIATSGQVNAYVSDVNGSVKRGDFLAVSPIKGVLMKASEQANQAIVGLALTDMTEGTSETISVDGENGGKKTIKVVNTSIEINQRVLAADNRKENFLRIFGQSLTGKLVSPLQVIVALVIFFIILIVEGSIIYGAIYSSIISIGRNPLSKKAIYRQLLQVSLLAVCVLTIGLGAVYAVLWI